jgi:hypothetical protein
MSGAPADDTTGHVVAHERPATLTHSLKANNVMPMHLSELLRHVEPSRLRQLGQLFRVDGDLPAEVLIELITDELPYCQTEQDGDCIGIDGAYFVAVDLIADIAALELLLETKWERREADGVVIKYTVDKSAEELSLGDVRLLLALLSIATSGEFEVGTPPELGDERFATVLSIETVKSSDAAVPLRPSQRPSRIPNAHRPSIPPGFSPTLDSIRPGRNSVPPEANASSAPKTSFGPSRDFVESILMLPRNSVIAAAFALSERGSDSHAVSIGTRGRALLRRDQLGVVEQLFDDVSETISRIQSPAERNDVERQLTKSLTFYGVKSTDASAVVSTVIEQGRFPEFYSDERPPPLEQVRSEFSLLAKRSQMFAVELLYDVFYRHCCATAESLRHSLGLPRPDSE